MALAAASASELAEDMPPTSRVTNVGAPPPSPSTAEFTLSMLEEERLSGVGPMSMLPPPTSSSGSWSSGSGDGVGGDFFFRLFFSFTLTATTPLSSGAAAESV